MANWRSRDLTVKIFQGKKTKNMIQSDSSEVYFWGNNHYGQLGVDNKEYEDCLYLPKLMRYNTGISLISCGFEHSFFLTCDGQIYCMGSNNYGQLGLAFNVLNRNSPTLVRGQLGNENFTDLSCGAYHTIGTANHKKLITWGRNDHGQCGTGSLEEKTKPSVIKFPNHLNLEPEILEQINITSISGGQIHSGAVLNTGEVFLWGANDYGQCAKPPTGQQGVKQIILEPSRVETDANTQTVCCGYTQSIYLVETGKVFGCGNNESQQLGVASQEELIIDPEEIPFDEPIKDLMSSNFNAGISEDNTLYIWGATPNGLLTTPEKIIGLENNVVQAKLGENFVCVLDSSNYVYSWGRNESGQLGLGTSDQQKDACIIDMLNEREITSLFCGRDYVMVLGSGHLDKRGLGSDEEGGEMLIEQDGMEVEGEREDGAMAGVEEKMVVVDMQGRGSLEGEDGDGVEAGDEGDEEEEEEEEEEGDVGEEAEEEADEEEGDGEEGLDGYEGETDQDEPSQNEPIYLQNSIADIYKKRDYASRENTEPAEEEEVEGNGFREEINIMKNLICCYELNRQGLVKIIGGLTEAHPNLLNEINPENVENMILLENLIEQYLSQIRFSVTDELKEFDFPDIELNQNSNQDTGKGFNRQGGDAPVYLQHHLSSHMKDLQTNYKSQGGQGQKETPKGGQAATTININRQYSTNISKTNLNLNESRQVGNATPSRSFIGSGGEENYSSYNRTKYANIDIDQLTKDLQRNKNKIRNRILEIEDHLSTHQGKQSQYSQAQSYSQSQYLYGSNNKERGADHTRTHQNINNAGYRGRDHLGV